MNCLCIWWCKNWGMGTSHHLGITVRERPPSAPGCVLPQRYLTSPYQLLRAGHHLSHLTGGKPEAQRGMRFTPGHTAGQSVMGLGCDHSSMTQAMSSFHLNPTFPEVSSLEPTFHGP